MDRKGYDYSATILDFGADAPFPDRTVGSEVLRPLRGPRDGRMRYSAMKEIDALVREMVQEGWLFQ